MIVNAALDLNDKVKESLEMLCDKMCGGNNREPPNVRRKGRRAIGKINDILSLVRRENISEKNS